MTTAKAKQLAADLVDAGAKVTLTPRDEAGTDWEVYAESRSGPVDVTAIANLATKYAVTSRSEGARFV